jgi:tRNA(Ile)-lysidine synthase
VTGRSLHDILRQGIGPDVTLPLGVAVSGGGDSLALLHLAQGTGWPVEAVTVNHGLRPEAASEAAMVARFCAGIGVPHATLHWSGPAATGNLMDQARRARIALIADWARARGISQVALGHTADDQAETLLMGLARKAGLDGLSGMRPAWRQDGVTWVRPLLSVGRSTLRDHLRRHGITWAEDPTNDDGHYARVKARRALRALAPLGITADGLAAVTAHLDATRLALDWTLDREAQRIVTEHAGALILDRAAHLALPIELQRRLLLSVLRWFSEAAYPPRETGLNRVQTAIRGCANATLSGCRIIVTKVTIRILREPMAAAASVPVGTLWDHRWMVEGPPGTVRALGPKGLPQVPHWRALGIPRDALLVTPAVWDGDTLLAAPLAGMENGWKARIVAPFHRFAVSH